LRENNTVEILPQENLLAACVALLQYASLPVGLPKVTKFSYQQS
jgi:hypothetical protein